MLINLIRGTGVTGLTGIPRFRSPRVHRPMLDVSRDETREIAVLAGLGFVDDPMNEDLALTRNRVRLRLLPLMRELNPQVDTALARASAALERDSDHLEAVASRLAADASDVAVPMSVIATIPRPLADRLLRRLLERNGIGPTADRIERMWSVATGASERQDLADGRSVIRHGALLVVE
jgi:tRNA(Ile)-lysidine synthase